MIKRFRKKFHLNQEQAARILGVTQPSISNYEKGLYPVPLSVQRLLSIYMTFPVILDWQKARLS